MIKQELELLIVGDEDQDDLLLGMTREQEKLSDWSTEVAKLCGLEEQEVRRVWEGGEDENSNKVALFPWQLVPSLWEEKENVRREKEVAKMEENRGLEAAEMWKRQAMLLTTPR